MPFDRSGEVTLVEHGDIYQHQGECYQALVRREDYQNNLLPAIVAIDSLQGIDVLELGAGTGRISKLIAPAAKLLIASDISLHMLRFAREELSALGLNNWHLSLESHLALPFGENSADVVISGWSFCHAAIDAGENWQLALDKALSEVARVLRPGGKLILIESLGTGFKSPNPPDVLGDYLDYLGQDGFNSTWIRTDYLFKDIVEAKQLIAFFFDDLTIEMWETEMGVVVPECTGLWWKRFL